MKPWINCSDQMPPEDADVIVKLADGSVTSGVFVLGGWMLNVTPLFREGKEMTESPIVAWKQPATL